MGSEQIFVSEDVSQYECPISGEIMTTPVLADDGHNYEREWIEKYFVAREQSGLPIISVWTGEPMSRELTPNYELRSKIEKSKLKLKDSVLSANLSTEIASLNCLNSAFKELDQLRDILAETLQGWKPPQVVIIGAESTGKSSLLERLIMMPVVPTAEHVCTRLPIHIRLRNSTETQAPKLEVFNTKSNKTEEGPYLISYQSGARAVADKMDELIQQEHGRLDSISADRIIILHVQGPHVPTLDLVDMPGLRTTPADMREATRTLLQEHIRIHDSGKCMTYLAVVPAPCGRPNTSLSMELVQAMGLESRTIGVLTKCDLVSSRHGEMDKVRRLLQPEPNEALGAVELAPHGWFATMNSQPDSAEGQGNLARLRHQAEVEASFFTEHMPEEVKAGRATCNALIKAVCTVYQDNLRTTWALETMRKLDAALRQARLANSALGQPQAGPGDEAEVLARSIATAVAQRKCKGFGSATESIGCLQRVMPPLIEGLVAIACGGRDSKSESGSKASSTAGADDFDGMAAAAKEECRQAVLSWGEYRLESCMSYLEQDESEEDEDSLLRNPPFQLGRFPSFITRIKEYLRVALEADQTDILGAVEPLVHEFFDFKSPFVKGMMDATEEFEETYQSTGTMTLRIDQEALRSLLVEKIRYVFQVKYTSGIATAAMALGMIERAANDVALDEWVESCAEERAAVLERIDRTEKARRGIVQALGLSDLQLQEMEDIIAKEANEKLETQEKAKHFAEATPFADKERMVVEARKVAESTVFVNEKKLVGTEAKRTACEDVSARIGKDVTTAVGLKFIAQNSQIGKEFAKEIEKLRMETDVRFKNMSRRFEMMIFLPLAVALMTCCFILLCWSII